MTNDCTISQQPTANSHDYASKRRVLFVTHYASLGGGANLSLYNLMLDLMKRYNIEPVLMAPYEGEICDRCRERGIKVFCVRYYMWFTHSDSIKLKIKGFVKSFLNVAFHYRKIFRLLKNEHFDLIHTNTTLTQLGDVIANHFHVPHIWHLREFTIGRLYLYYFMPRYIVRKKYMRADAVAAISDSIFDSYVNDLKLCSPKKTVMIYNGIRIPEAYNKTYMSGGKINFCLAGLIVEPKCQLTAVKACIKLKSDADKFTLNIIGDDTSNYALSLKQLVKTEGLEGVVKFWGFRADINDILRTMDIGLMTSDREPFGRVTVEYMMNYMPVIGANTGATPEIVINNETGCIFGLNDSDMLAELMHKFIMNPGLIREMGMNGRERAVKNFSLERNTDEVYKLYQEILSR